MITDKPNTEHSNGTNTVLPAVAPTLTLSTDTEALAGADGLSGLRVGATLELVSVLFARKDSVYKKLGVDVWDIERDARLWPGGNPIVAHPPCRAWGAYKGFAKPRPGEKELAIWSIRQIRRWGGVLEHPRASSLWKEMELPIGEEVDEYGGRTISIDQKWFGHKAKKATLLYVCGCKNLPKIPLNFDAVTHYVGYPKSFKGKSRNGMKEISKAEREHTPIHLAKWLIEVARNCYGFEPAKCDCQKPWGNPRHISNYCPTHNDYPSANDANV